MNKITTEFQDGQILHAADLNPLVTSINQAADELDTKANSATLANTTRTANNALTAANNAATVAATAQTTATNAETSATTATVQAAQALATANSIIADEIPAIKESHYRYVRIVIVQNMPIQQTGTDTFDGITWDQATKKYAFFKSLIPGQEPTLFATAIGANELFQNELADGTWSSPKPNVLFSDGTDIYHGVGNALFKLSQTSV